jgi:hypothetical protein
MKNSKNMKSLINKYISLAKESIVQREDTSANKISLLKSWKDRLIEKVEKIESHQFFEDLISITREVYRDNFFEDSYRDIQRVHMEDMVVDVERIYRGGDVEDVTADWEFLVKTFFRRSGFYINLSKDEPIDIDLVCRQYDEAFKAKEVPVRYLAPIEFAAFYDVDKLDFPSFSIRRFSPQELSKVINNTVNEVFYPEAIWDVDKLSMFWFIDVIVPKVNTNKLLQNNDYFAYFGNYRHDPENIDPIKDALKIMALFNWESCNGFHVPFVSQVDKYFLAYPDSFPIGIKLEMDNIYDDLDYEERNYYHHKIISQKPLILCQLGEEKINQFIEIVSVVDNQLSYILNQWPFLNNALEFLLKAFYQDPFYRPMDKMLWNIVTIEALLGEKGDGVTERLASRLCRILGKSDDERKEIKRDFKKIYDLRCSFVHGRSWDEKIDRKYLLQSRDLARRACLWFFFLLSFISTSCQYSPKKHFRENVLSLIDTHLIFDEIELKKSLC